jgi:SAM-dependent methyltransferase
MADPSKHIHAQEPVDDGRDIDWGKTSDDYARHRPSPPDSYFEKLKALGIGLPGQRILDLATGTGFLARRFARQGSVVAALDISDVQIATAKRLAKEDGVTIDFRIAPAEEVPLSDDSFDAITVNQGWLYFDKTRAIPEVKRLLVPGGVLMTSHFSWLPRVDPIARASEHLVLKFNPAWSAADWDGEVPPIPPWSQDDFVLCGYFRYDERIGFTRESWRGRFRACRGVGASMTPEEVAEFDAAHGKLLSETVPDAFSVLFRMQAHLFGVIGTR